MTMQAAQITKGPRETHKAYVLRKCRAAVKQGAKLVAFPAVLGDDEIYMDSPNGYVLLACVSRGEGRTICNRIQHGWKH
jgi:hypothetical protein